MNLLFDYLKIKQATELLGVSPSTRRNWDRTWKVKAWRHPVNSDRLYPRYALHALWAELTTPEPLEATDAS
jgi:hypothetical protein